MARFDSSSEVIIEYFGLDFDPEDPGKTGPVDLCKECSKWFDPSLEIDHPPYEDWDKYCAMCGNSLTEEDNGW